MMSRVVVALCLAHAAMVGDALGYGVPKKDPLEVPSEAYDVNADPDNTALVPITALGIPAVPGVPTVSGLREHVGLAARLFPSALHGRPDVRLRVGDQRRTLWGC